jgi:type VI secretion system protein ImpK
MPSLVLPAEVEAALRRYRVFYQELFTIKRLLRDSDWGAVLGKRAAAGALEDQLLHAVRQRLRNVLPMPALGGATPPDVDPCYVCAAVADAALLQDLSWPGRDGWSETPLEVLLYRSRIAGDRIFQSIEDLARRRRPDTDGLAMTILLALETGFRGRFHGIDDGGEIERQKARLFELVFRMPPDAAVDIDSLTAGAADALTSSRSARLPELRPWALAILCVVMGYLVVSLAVWWDGVGSLVDKAASANEILQSLRP